MKNILKKLTSIVLCFVICAAVTAYANGETSIVLQDDDIFLNVGESTTLVAMTVGGAKVSWTSGNDKIATVSADGKVTAVAAGNTRITASVGDVKVSATVQVKDKSTSLLASAGDLVLNYNEQAQELEYTLYYTGAILDNQRLTIRLYCTEYRNGAWCYDTLYSFNNPLLSELDISSDTIKGSVRLGRQTYRNELFRDFALEIVGGDASGGGSSGTVTVYTYMTNAKALLETERTGDVNNDRKINAMDASLVLQYDVGLIAEIKNGDVNRDGYTNSFDASLILRYDVGLIDSFAAWQK